MAGRILIVRLSALGDTALTLPLLSALRANLPEAEIGWLVGEYAAPLLAGNPQLDRLHIWKKKDMNLPGILKMAGEVRSEAYEVSLDPQGLTLSALFPLLARIPIRVGFSRGFMDARELSPFFTNRKVTPPKELTHIAARTLYMAKALGLEPPGDMPVHLKVDPAASETIDRWLDDAGVGGKAIVFGIGAGWPTRFWPVPQIEKLVRAAGEKGYACIALWGPREKNRIAEWMRILKDAVLWAPPTTISEMIVLLRRCERYAGPDSAPLHLAALLGKPTFSWYGSSDPARTAPRGPSHAHVARGPHHWRRKRIFRTALEKLSAEDALPVFMHWLSGNSSSTVPQTHMMRRP